MGVVPALQLRYVTRSWCFCSWFLSEYFTPPLLLVSLPEKGNHNKLCCATSPYFPLPSLPLSISLSLYSHPHSFIIPTPGSQSPSLSVLPPLPFFLVKAVMALKDVCDVIQTDCSSVSGMPLPQLLPAAPHPPPPTSMLQSLLRQ